MAGDRLTPVSSLILIKPKGGKRLRPAHLVYEKQPSAGVALARTSSRAIRAASRRSALLGERRDMGEGGRLPNIGQALSPLSVSLPPCRVRALSLPCISTAGGQAWRRRSSVRICTLCAPLC